MKELVKEAPVLQLVDNKKPLLIQCDASEKGIGTALPQNGKHVDFASRDLTDTETRYTQIRKELISIAFIDKFGQFTFGPTVYVQFDPKLFASTLVSCSKTTALHNAKSATL